MRKSLAMTIALFLTLVPVAANAHDEVGATSPADSAIVEAGAFDVSVEFDEPIMQTAGNQGEAIEVVDANGNKVSNGCVTVAGEKLSTSIDVDTVGLYRVSWRSVSVDGHSTQGEFAFTVENQNGYVSAGIPAISSDCAASANQAGTSTDNSALIGLAIAIALVVIGSVAGAIRFGKKPDPKAFD